VASPGMGQSALVLRIAVRLETASSAGPIHDVQFISAMSSLEPEIGSWSSSLAAQRLANDPQRRVGLGVEQIRDLLWTYSSPELYHLLVLQHGWTLVEHGEFLFRGMTLNCSTVTT
jgi:hypothetical protein